jgi:hypothetical protein
MCSAARLGHVDLKMSAPSSSHGRPDTRGAALTPSAPCLVARPRHRCNDASILLPPAHPRRPGAREPDHPQRATARALPRPGPPSGGVVIRDEARHTSSAPARRTTGSGHRVKDEGVAASPPLPPAKKKQWWKKEAEAALRGDDDEEEFPGLNFMVARSVDEDYRHITLDPR